MKKAHYIIISMLLILIGVSAFLGIRIKNSPEFALMRIAQDVKESGIDGLDPHLTQDAKKVVDTISAVTENELITSVIGLLNKNDYIGIMKSELRNIQWDVEDVLKSSDRASVLLSFNYTDKLVGTINVSMVREAGAWKINNLEWPKFEKIDWD